MLFRNKQQTEISEQRRMPVDGVGSDALTNVTGETVQLYYFNSGVLTTDAGQAAGTVVVGKLANRNILGALGDVVGSYGDTSLTFTSTALTTLKKFDQKAAEEAERDSEDETLSLSQKATAVTNGFGNGDYCIDHRTGTVYGKKASAQVTLTSTAYSVNIAVSGGGGGIASEVDLTKVNGTTVNEGGVSGGLGVGGNTADGVTDAGNPVAIGGLAQSVQRAAVTAGQRVKAVFNLFGEMVIAGYDWTNQLIKVAESEPLDEKYLNNAIDVDTTNVSATTHYYPASTGATIDGYQDHSLTGKFIDADGTLTLTFEASNDEDSATADWNGAYFYDDATNSTVNSLTVTNGTLLISASLNNMNFRRYRWVVVASGATNTVILKGRNKAL